LIAVYLAVLRDYTQILTTGEVGVVMLLASDRRQARILKRYVSGLLNGTPMLKQLIAHETVDAIELSNAITIEIHTSSFRAVRGYTIVAAILDELAFWDSDDSANPDTEVLNALRPAMATVPHSLMIAISSPYARKGELYKAYSAYFGKEDANTLVWQAATRTMNPLVPQTIIDHAYADDEAVARAEYGAEFRRDLEAFIAREVVDACVPHQRFELSPVDGIDYVGFTDPSGGSQDSMTLAIAHQENERMILDVIRECHPPFSPEQVVREFCQILTQYRVHVIVGDRYGAHWVQEQFEKHGVTYTPSEKTKSDLYRELLPMLNSKTVELLDHRRLITQLCGLERRTARGGRDSIDHSAGTHDDVINAVAGALVIAGEDQGGWDIIWGGEEVLLSEETLTQRRERSAQLIREAITQEGVWFPV